MKTFFLVSAKSLGPRPSCLFLVVVDVDVIVVSVTRLGDLLLSFMQLLKACGIIFWLKLLSNF